MKCTHSEDSDEPASLRSLIFSGRSVDRQGSIFYFKCIVNTGLTAGITSGLGTRGRFSAILYKGDNFCDFIFTFLHASPFWKGVYYKREEFAPIGSKFFSFTVDSISEGIQNSVDRVNYPDSVYVPLNRRWVHMTKRPFSLVRLNYLWMWETVINIFPSFTVISCDMTGEFLHDICNSYPNGDTKLGFKSDLTSHMKIFIYFLVCHHLLK